MKEFTKREFDKLVADNGYEVYTEAQVKAFLKQADSLVKSEEDEFERSCVAADLMSLTRAIVVDDNLNKSVMFYRESQIEPRSESIYKSTSGYGGMVYRDTPLNRYKGVVGMPVVGEEIAKARKAEPIGTEKTFGGKPYIKTAKGWRPKPKGTKAVKKDETTPTKKEVPVKREVEVSQYGGRKDEIVGQIASERMKLMNKYGEKWQSEASTKETDRLRSLVDRATKLGENFANEFGDTGTPKKEEKQMTAAEMREYAMKNDPEAKQKGSKKNQSTNILGNVSSNRSLEKAKEDLRKMQENIANFEAALENSNLIINAYGSELNSVLPGLDIESVPFFLKEETYQRDGIAKGPYKGYFNAKTCKTFEAASRYITRLNESLKKKTDGKISLFIDPYSLNDLVRDGKLRVGVELHVHE